MFFALRRKISLAIRSSVLGFCALICIFVGSIFFTVAIFIALASAKSAIFASLVIGGVYFGLGIILAGIAMLLSSKASKYVPPQSPPMTRAAMMTSIIEAFIFGLTAGRGSGR